MKQKNEYAEKSFLRKAFMCIVWACASVGALFLCFRDAICLRARPNS